MKARFVWLEFNRVAETLGEILASTIDHTQSLTGGEFRIWNSRTSQAQKPWRLKSGGSYAESVERRPTKAIGRGEKDTK